MVESGFEMKKDHDMLSFSTSFFRAEKESVLHKGVYTKEFSAMLIASAAGLLAYLLLLRMPKLNETSGYIILLCVFVSVFLVSRNILFREKVRKALFNRETGTVTISTRGIFRSSAETIPFHKIASVRRGTRTFSPENIDGINFVQKISLQHGSAMPGLGAVEEYKTLVLKLTDGTERVLYAVRVEEDPDPPIQVISDFISGE